MNSRLLLLAGLLSAASPVPVAAGDDKQISTTTQDDIVEQPYQFSAEFTIEQAYLGGADVQRGNRRVTDLDEYYSNVVFVYTPRIKFGILRLGAQWERYSLGFPNGGEQLPNTLQAVNSIVGLDTKFSDSILVRFEAQPGFYGTSFKHLDGDSFNIPFVLGGTYIYNPEVQFIFGLGVNFQSRFPVLPGGGIRWKFAPDWVLNAVLPTPRLEYQASRPRGQVWLGCLEQKVIMIAHQEKGMHPLAGLAQSPHKRRAVLVAAHDRFSPIAAIEDVIERPADSIRPLRAMSPNYLLPERTRRAKKSENHRPTPSDCPRANALA